MSVEFVLVGKQLTVLIDSRFKRFFGHDGFFKILCVAVGKRNLVAQAFIVVLKLGARRAAFGIDDAKLHRKANHVLAQIVFADEIGTFALLEGRMVVSYFIGGQEDSSAFLPVNADEGGGMCAVDAGGLDVVIIEFHGITSSKKLQKMEKGLASCAGRWYNKRAL